MDEIAFSQSYLWGRLKKYKKRDDGDDLFRFEWFENDDMEKNGIAYTTYHKSYQEVCDKKKCLPHGKIIKPRYFKYYIDREDENGERIPRKSFYSYEEAYQFQYKTSLENNRLKNPFEIQGDIVRMKLTSKNENPVFTIFNKDYLDIVIKAGPWYAAFKRNLKGVYYAERCRHSPEKDEQRTMCMHQFICPVPNPNPENLTPDHINRDTLDNRTCNLRLATKQEQNYNRGLQSRNKVGVTGITIITNEGRTEFFAQHTFTDKKKLRKGFCDTEYGKELALKLSKKCKETMISTPDSKNFEKKWRPVLSSILREAKFRKTGVQCVPINGIKNYRAQMTFPLKNGNPNNKRAHIQCSVNKYGEKGAEDLAWELRYAMLCYIDQVDWDKVKTQKKKELTEELGLTIQKKKPRF